MIIHASTTRASKGSVSLRLRAAVSPRNPAVSPQCGYTAMRWPSVTKYKRAVRLSPQRLLSSRIVFIWCAWTVFACYSAVASRYQTVMWGKPIPWHTLFFSELAYSWISALVTPAILLLANRYRPQRPGILRAIALHGCAAVVSASVVKLLWDLVYQPPHSFFHGGITFRTIAGSIANGLDSGVLLYWIVVVAAWAYADHKRLGAEVLAASELRRQFATAQVDALRMQIHPHFLFNTLHTVTGLLHDDAEAAERMIARLSVFLRHSLAGARNPIVPLSEELEFVRLYLEIEAVRFEDRLQVHYDIDSAAAQVPVPNLILQPLVENAIRYAIARRTSGGHLTIAARVAGSQLEITVTDNGAGADAAPLELHGTGVGLANARARLKVLYGSRQDLALKPNEEGGSSVYLSLPIENASEHQDWYADTEFRSCAS